MPCCAEPESHSHCDSNQQRMNTAARHRLHLATLHLANLTQCLTCGCTCAALTFNDILAKKLQAPTNQIDEKVLQEYSPEEYLKYQNDVPVGPEFE